MRPLTFVGPIAIIGMLAIPSAQTAALQAAALAENVARLKLDVGQILSLHGPRVATMADLTSAATAR